MVTLMSLVHSITLAFVLGLALYASAKDCEIDGEYNYKVLFKTVWRAKIEGNCLSRTNNKSCAWYLQFCNNNSVNPCGVGHACEVNSSGLNPVTVGSSPVLIADGPTRFVVRFQQLGSNDTKCKDSAITINVTFECDKN
uniref:Putative secreted protein n=1 Tax=Amblyomma triste TaxID=251400 RepID=A0A023GCW0_AMBTT